MLSIRCKNFYDDGSVKETCPEGSSCPYVHPSNPQWEKSVPYRSDGDTRVEKITFRKAYRKMISFTEHAVRIQIELNKAKEDLSRCKRTQSSKIYAHTGPSTRQFLDTQRKNYAQNVANLEKRLSRTLCVLSELSCGQKFGAFTSSELDDDGLKSYINELNQWIESLRHSIPQPLPPNSEDPSKWTWGQIEVSVAVLSDLCENFAELSLMKRYTNMESETDDGMTKVSVVTNRGQEADHLVHHARAKEILEQRIERDGEELERLCARLRELEDLQSQMEKRMEIYTQWAEEDAVKIQALLERVKLLHMLPCPAVQPPDDVLEATSKFVAEESKRIVAAYFSTVVVLCSQNNNALLKELDVRLLNSMKQLTRAIYERVMGAEVNNSEVK